ncbi:hypothetical protein D3C83_278300 [compost metagenome]
MSLRSFTWTCVMRSWCCVRNGTGDVLLPARKWPMSRFAPLNLAWANAASQWAGVVSAWPW